MLINEASDRLCAVDKHHYRWIKPGSGHGNCPKPNATGAAGGAGACPCPRGELTAAAALSPSHSITVEGDGW